MKTFPAVRALRVAFLLAVATSPACLLAQTNEPAITPTEHMDLFDGKSLDGWAFFSKDTNADAATAASIWSVKDGKIVCQGKPYGYARTPKRYRDYKLHIEWRWPDGLGNSGVFLHINPPDKVWPLCYEAQLQAGNAGDIRLNGGSTIPGFKMTDPKRVPRRQPSSEKPAGEWNSYDIVCRGNSITIRVNDVLQNDVTGTGVDSGMIGLQAEGKLVEFRNFTLDPLPAAEPVK